MPDEDSEASRLCCCLSWRLSICFCIILQGSSNALAELEAADLNFWVKEWPKDFTFSNLKAVTMTCISGAPHEMQFIKLLLANSPLLQTMTISPCVFVLDGTSNMLIELLRFRCASPQAEVLFIDE